MALRILKPITPGTRFYSVSSFSELTPGAKPEKSLLAPKKRVVDETIPDASPPDIEVAGISRNIASLTSSVESMALLLKS